MKQRMLWEHPEVTFIQVVREQIKEHHELKKGFKQKNNHSQSSCDLGMTVMNHHDLHTQPLKK